MKLSPIFIAVGAVIAVILLVIVGTGVWGVSTYNTLIDEEEAVDSQWAQVQNQYQRKVDLIPSLVATVESYQEFEASTLTNITELRTQWMAAETPEEQMNVSNQLDAQLATIIVTYEAYPYLASIEVVQSLMYELAGTENRIAVERMRYNDDVKDFNAHVKKFPANMIAGIGDFEERSYYEGINTPDAP